MAIKSLFSKRNLPLHVAASEYIVKVNGKYKLKTKTGWYYQIQGELTATCLKNADLIIEQFSIECRKTKTIVITLTNHKRRKAIHCPIKTRSNYTKRRKTCASKSRLVLVLLLIGRESGARFLSQSLSVVMQNQSKCKLLSTLK